METPRIEELALMIYSNFSKYFESKDILITGSPIYYKLGLSDKKTWRDLDINITSDDIGDDIILELKDYFENKSNLASARFKIRKVHGLYAMCLTNYGQIDFFRNTWDKNELKTKVEVLPGVFTYYLSKESMIKGIEQSIGFYSKIMFVGTEEYNEKISKYINTIQEMKSKDILK